MAFQPGNKLAKGRPKGALNKRTEEAHRILAEAGYCPITALIDGNKLALQRFTEEIDKEDAGRISPMESSAAKYLKLFCDTAADLASYVFPKLKAIERTPTSPLVDMSPEQKLEAMKQAVRLLEAQVKAGHGSDAP